MAKTNVAEASAGGAGGGDGDAPLIDLNDASLKKLIARGKKRGYLTYDELNEMLPQDASSDLIEDITSALSEMGVNIVDNEEASDDEKREEPDDSEEETSSDDGSGEVFQIQAKKETVD